MNPLKKISDALFGTQGIFGPRFATDTSPGGQYSRLRYHAFTIQREQAGIPTPPPDHPLWAVLMESGHPEVTETLALVSDGTSSVYMSDGDGVIGGHGYENVRKANAEFIRLANRDRHHFQAVEAFPLPAVGFTVFYARTDAELLFAAGTQESFIEGQHVLSELFQAGHEAMTQLHIITVEKEISSFKNFTSRDYYKAGNSYAARADFYRAIAAYNKSIERNPNYFEAYLDRGIAYGALGNFDHALAEFNKAIELYPNDPRIYMNRANVYKFKKESDKVLADYSKAIELNSGLADAYMERGLFYKSSGHTSKAIKDFDRFLGISTDHQKRSFVEEQLKKIRGGYVNNEDSLRVAQKEHRARLPQAEIASPKEPAIIPFLHYPLIGMILLLIFGALTTLYMVLLNGLFSAFSLDPGFYGLVMGVVSLLLAIGTMFLFRRRRKKA
jgi:tetratricopeptide (TPR) repeat protein